MSWCVSDVGGPRVQMSRPVGGSALCVCVFHGKNCSNTTVSHRQTLQAVHRDRSAGHFNTTVRCQLITVDTINGERKKQNYSVL